MSEQRTTACGSCPFARTCKPGNLGGSVIETYLGQIVGPFFLPCHSKKDYKGKGETFENCDCQCAGAAVFRANIGVASAMPAGLLRLPCGSDDNVFPTLVAFMQHHAPELTPVERMTHMANLPHYLEVEMTAPEARHSKPRVAARDMEVDI